MAMHISGRPGRAKSPTVDTQSTVKSNLYSQVAWSCFSPTTWHGHWSTVLATDYRGWRRSLTCGRSTKPAHSYSLKKKPREHRRSASRDRLFSPQEERQFLNVPPLLSSQTFQWQSWVVLPISVASYTLIHDTHFGLTSHSRAREQN